MEIRVVPISVTENKYQALRRENTGLLKTNNELRAAINRATAALSAKDAIISKHQLTIQNLTAELNSTANSSAEVARLKAALNAAVADKHAADLRHEAAMNKLHKNYTAACNQRDSYKAQLDQQSKAMARNFVTVNGLEYNQAAIEKLLDKVAALQDAVRERAAKVDSLTTELNAVKSKNKMLACSVETLTKGFEAAQTALADKIGELNTAKKENLRLTNNVEVLKREFNASQSALEEKINELNAAREETSSHTMTPTANTHCIDISQAAPTMVLKLKPPFAMNVGLLTAAAQKGAFTIINGAGEFYINKRVYNADQIAHIVAADAALKDIVPGLSLDSVVKAARKGLFKILNGEGDFFINGHTYTPEQVGSAVAASDSSKLITTPLDVYPVNDHTVKVLSSRLRDYIKAVQTLVKQLDETDSETPG